MLRSSINLSFSQTSCNFSSSDEELEEPRDVATPDLSDHENTFNLMESPRRENYFDRTSEADQNLSCDQSNISPKPQPYPRMHRRVQTNNNNHLKSVKVEDESKSKSESPKCAAKSEKCSLVEKVKLEENLKLKTNHSSGYCSPSSLSMSSSTTSSSSSSTKYSVIEQLCVSTAADVQNQTDIRETEEEVFPIKLWIESEECKKLSMKCKEPIKKSLSSNSCKKKLVRGNSTEPMKALPITEPQVNARSSKVDYTSDVKLPSGNTICMIEDATSLARHKQQSVTLHGHSNFPVTRRYQNDNWRSNTIDHDVTMSSYRRQNIEERRSVPAFPFSFKVPSSNLKKNNLRSDHNYITEKDFSASLANLARASEDQEVFAVTKHPFNNRQFNSVSVATGRRISENKDPCCNLSKHGRANSNLPGSNISHTGSLWSLNFASRKANSFGSNEKQRRPSLRSRLKEAFSFQNIRSAISMEKVTEEPSSYAELSPTSDDVEFENSSMKKATSITSIINTVRMRKRKSRSKQNRNTIAVDSFSFETIDKKRSSLIDRNQIEIGHPNHFRPIGRVLNINASSGDVLVEIVKPPSGPYGFYLGRYKDNKCVYISSLNDGYPEKMYSGLMKLGDIVTHVNGINVDDISLDAINDMILDSENVQLCIKPAKVHRV